MATPHRWLQDDAVKLQLSEVHATLDMLDERTRPIFVALTGYRFDPERKKLATSGLEAMQKEQKFSPAGTWLLSLVSKLQFSPEDYPFCLNDDEFEYYTRTNFGDKMPAIKNIYHPPNFYKALAEDLATLIIGGAVAVYLPALVPGAANVSATSASGLATAGGRAVVGGAVNSGLSHILPGGSWDAAHKNIRWPRYLADYQRRLLR